MTNNNFDVLNRTIGKDDLIFNFTDFSCWVYRVNPRANFWRKAISYFTFKDAHEKDLKFNTFLINYKAMVDRKDELRKKRLADNKKRRDALLADIKVWDLFHRSWGYDMTFNDFYQVTKVVGKKIYVRPISSEITDWYRGYSWEEKPVKDSFCWDEKSYLLSPHGWIKVCDYDHAYKSEWDRSYYFNRED